MRGELWHIQFLVGCGGSRRDWRGCCPNFWTSERSKREKTTFFSLDDLNNCFPECFRIIGVSKVRKYHIFGADGEKLEK